MVWKADHIQGVVFPLPGTKQSSALELWRVVFPNSEPESYQGAGPSPIGQTHASGIFDNLQIVLSTQLGRIDIQLTPNVDSASPEQPPQIEDISHGLSKLQDVMRPIIRFVRVARVATVVQLSVHCDSPSQVVNILNDTSGASFPSDSTDNIYQFNVRKKYDSDAGIPMNRVVTWSSGSKQLFSAQVDMSASNFGFSPAVIIPIAALKMDLNSATNHDISEKAEGMIAEHCGEVIALISVNMDQFHG